MIDKTVPLAEWPSLLTRLPAERSPTNELIEAYKATLPPRGERGEHLEAMMAAITDAIIENADGNSQLALEGMRSLVANTALRRLFTREVLRALFRPYCDGATYGKL